MATSIKSEPIDSMSYGEDQSDTRLPDPVSLEDSIMALCVANQEGVTDEMIVREYPNIDADKRRKALQRLLSTGKLDLYKQGTTLLYRLKATPSSSASKTKGFESEERLVYQIVEDAENKGIWIRDIRNKSNLGLTQVNKILKVLESKRLIKAVKSVQASKKKVYMLFDLVPDESVTGGAWYCDQDFETEFVDVLNQHCLRFLQQKAFKADRNHQDPISKRDASYASPTEVWKFISDLGISRVALSANNIETILNTLIYDGKAEVTVQVAMETSSGGGGNVRLYRVANPFLKSAGLDHIPCAVCPVYSSCCDTGPVCPAKCQYLKDWMAF